MRRTEATSFANSSRLDGYKLVVDDKPKAVLNSLSIAKMLAQNFLEAYRDVRIIGLEEGAPAVLWTYDYRCQKWNEGRKPSAP